jgi:hypothetical protein
MACTKWRPGLQPQALHCCVTLGKTPWPSWPSISSSVKWSSLLHLHPPKIEQPTCSGLAQCKGWGNKTDKTQSPHGSPRSLESIRGSQHKIVQKHPDAFITLLWQYWLAFFFFFCSRTISVSVEERVFYQFTLGPLLKTPSCLASMAPGAQGRWQRWPVPGPKLHSLCLPGGWQPHSIHSAFPAAWPENPSITSSKSTPKNTEQPR